MKTKLNSTCGSLSIDNNYAHFWDDYYVVDEFQKYLYCGILYQTKSNYICDALCSMLTHHQRDISRFNIVDLIILCIGPLPVFIVW